MNIATVRRIQQKHLFKKVLLLQKKSKMMLRKKVNKENNYREHGIITILLTDIAANNGLQFLPDCLAKV